MLEPGIYVALKRLVSGFKASLFKFSHCSLLNPKIKSLLENEGVETNAKISPVLGFIATDALLSF